MHVAPDPESRPRFQHLEKPAEGPPPLPPELESAYERAFQALRVLGHGGAEARDRLYRVREKLKGAEQAPTDGELVKLALRA